MRKYNHKTLVKIWCNNCGRELALENEIVKEGAFSADISWGYFSKRDGERHCFDLCEECYNQITSEFKLPVSVGNNTELI